MLLLSWFAGVSQDVLRNVVQKVQQRGRGGRTPAGDPRLDPNVDPKKAKRILANRCGVPCSIRLGSSGCKQYS